MVSVKRHASGSQSYKSLKNSLQEMTSLVLDVAQFAKIDANISLSNISLPYDHPLIENRMDIYAQFNCFAFLPLYRS